MKVKVAIRNIQHRFTKRTAGSDHVISLHGEITRYVVMWRKVGVIYFRFSKSFCPLSLRAFSLRSC